MRCVNENRKKRKGLRCVRCVRCVNENRKQRKRLIGCFDMIGCFDRPFLLAGACVRCVWVETGLNTWTGRRRRRGTTSTEAAAWTGTRSMAVADQLLHSQLPRSNCRCVALPRTESWPLLVLHRPRTLTERTTRLALPLPTKPFKQITSPDVWESIRRPG